MDNRPIGFFDSGLGGLTCIPILFKKLPDERVIYFGDTARTPYGSKAVSTIKTYAMQIADFLKSKDVKMMVIACNTITATCLKDLRERFPDTPVVGIISPAADKVAKVCTEENRIGIIATKVTIESDDYNRMILERNPELKVFSKATPAFVPLIEEGIVDNEIMDLTIKYYLDDFIRENDIDTLVLGCTHYPIIRERLLELYPELTIINPSYEIITPIRQILEERDALAVRSDSVSGDGGGESDSVSGDGNSGSKGSSGSEPGTEAESDNVFYASDLSQMFEDFIQRILNVEKSDIVLKFKNLDL